MMPETLASAVVVHALGWALLQSLWQGVVIGAAAAVVLAGLRRGTANARYLVACGALVSLVAVVALTAVGTAADLRAAAPAPAASTVATASRPAAPPPMASEGVNAVAAVADAASVAEASDAAAWAAPAVLAWGLGVLLLSIRLAVAWVRVGHLRRGARAVPRAVAAQLEAVARRVDVARAVRVVETAVVSVPALVGWLRPVILLPAGALAGLPAAQLEAVLAHELAHVRRHDYLVNLVQSAIEVLLFYHPVTWWLSRRVRVEREHCCDDIAVACTGSRVQYARALVALESRRVGGVAPGLAATDGPLTRRVRRLLLAREPAGSPAGLVATVALGLLVVVVVGERGLAATPGPQTPTPTVTVSADVPDDEAVVRGRVADARTGAAVANARVRLTQSAPLGVNTAVAPGTREATTDDTGRFEITGVVPFDYVIQASAEGYISRFFGQPMGGPRGIPVTVPGGRVVSDITFELERTGVVTGRVIGPDGEGLVGVEVELLERRFRPGGLTPVAVGYAQTEAQGVFRVERVPPGEYLVRAYAPPALRPDSDDSSLVFASTLFPGVPDAGGAQWMLLAPGQELFGVDFELGTARTRTVDGLLVDPGGPGVAGAVVELWSAGAELWVVDGSGRVTDAEGMPTGAAVYPTGVVEPDGTFTIEGVRPGLYSLMVLDRSQRLREWPRMEVPVRDADVRDLQVVATDPARIAARFMDEDGRPLPFDASQLGIGYISRMSTGYFQVGGGFEIQVARDGAFAMQFDSGHVDLSVRNVPSGWALQGFRVDGVRVPADTVEVLPGDSLRLDVLLTDQVGTVSGTVVDDDEQRVARALVVLFPTDRDGWAAERLVRTTFADHDGVFAIDGLVEGDYQVVAVPWLPDMAWRDPGVLAALWPRATSVRMIDGDDRAVELELSPVPPGLPEP